MDERINFLTYLSFDGWDIDDTMSFQFYNCYITDPSFLNGEFASDELLSTIVMNFGEGTVDVYRYIKGIEDSTPVRFELSYHTKKEE